MNRLSKQAKRIFVMGGLVLTSLTLYYPHAWEKQLRKQIRSHNVTLASPVFEKKTEGKHPETFFYFRVDEFPRIQFQLTEYRYDLVDKKNLPDLTIGTSLKIWFKGHFDHAKTEWEVYGVRDEHYSYLDVDQAIRTELNARKDTVLFSFVLMVVSVFLYLRLSLKRKN